MSRFAADSTGIGDLPLSRLLVNKDANYPWLILVPRRKDASEIIDLPEPERAQLMSEIALVASALKQLTRCDKLNIAALGNVVPQLHVHIVARRKGDAAWPGPVWGAVPRPAPMNPRSSIASPGRSRASSAFRTPASLPMGTAGSPAVEFSLKIEYSSL